MTQNIDPNKLKAAAEHLEWVLKQYPDSFDVQSLLRSLTPLIEHAKAGQVLEPIDRKSVPGAYNFGDGVYVSYKSPSVDEAYVSFSVEIRGGLTAQEERINEDTEAMRNSINIGAKL